MAMQSTKSGTEGQSTTADTVYAVDLDRFLVGSNTTRQRLNEVPIVSQSPSSTHKALKSLTQNGQNFLDCLNESLSFEYKQAWYIALRKADVMLQGGRLADFRKLIYEASCRRNPAFQWGLCQRLGDLTANSKSTNLKYLSKFLNDVAAEAVLRRFETDEDPTKRALYQAYRKADPNSYPMMVALPSPSTPSLLDRAHDTLDVEIRLRRLQKKRLKEWTEAMYVPLQAKADQQASDKDRFLLMDEVKQFLDSDQKVFVILGDFGSGKTTFNHALECDLWNTYMEVDGCIPLYIDLTVIHRPNYDLIGKRLRRIGFTEAQIRR
ncbi:hypothetical protein BGZ65_001550 [Modicella reniformis]|uniref:Arm-like repeat domain-containing protein n=1 Tax=Modicella reniformis TaxID=1440133 RepID=A0A9P6ILK7_9FUNG|nr:hypothetical protein BGZ65_001550 [Modicella reniformis]